MGLGEVPFEFLFSVSFSRLCALRARTAVAAAGRAAPRFPLKRTVQRLSLPHPTAVQAVCSGAHMYERGLVQGSTITRIASWAQAEKSKIPMFRLRVSAGSLPVLRAISSGGLYL
jgi:hypothetical protein